LLDFNGNVRHDADGFDIYPLHEFSRPPSWLSKSSLLLKSHQYGIGIETIIVRCLPSHPPKRTNGADRHSDHSSYTNHKAQILEVLLGAAYSVLVTIGLLRAARSGA
jgi:hypothetical protein